MYSGFGLGAVDPAVVARAKALKPACYTKEFDDCLGTPSTSDACAALNEWYKADEKSYDAYMDTIPYCSEKQLSTAATVPSTSDFGKRDALVAVGGVALGLLLSFLVR